MKKKRTKKYNPHNQKVSIHEINDFLWPLQNFLKQLQSEEGVFYNENDEILITLQAGGGVMEMSKKGEQPFVAAHNLRVISEMIYQTLVFCFTDLNYINKITKIILKFNDDLVTPLFEKKEVTQEAITSSNAFIDAVKEMLPKVKAIKFHLVMAKITYAFTQNDKAVISNEEARKWLYDCLILENKKANAMFLSNYSI